VNHFYLSDPAKIDLGKLREEAQNRLDPRGTYRGQKPSESIIHFHPKYNPVLQGYAKTKAEYSCEGFEHEEYKFEEVQL
jgi:hypothetical protein